MKPPPHLDVVPEVMVQYLAKAAGGAPDEETAPLWEQLVNLPRNGGELFLVLFTIAQAAIKLIPAELDGGLYFGSIGDHGETVTIDPSEVPPMVLVVARFLTAAANDDHDIARALLQAVPSTVEAGAEFGQIFEGLIKSLARAATAMSRAGEA